MYELIQEDLFTKHRVDTPLRRDLMETKVRRSTVVETQSGFIYFIDRDYRNDDRHEFRRPIHSRSGLSTLFSPHNFNNQQNKVLLKLLVRNY